MSETRLQVPTDLRYSAEKAIDQAQKAFDIFFDAANRSVASIPSPSSEISKKTLSLAEQNMRASFDHVRKLIHATDFDDAMKIQSEFVKRQFANAEEQMKQIADTMNSAAKGTSEKKC